MKFIYIYVYVLKCISQSKKLTIIWRYVYWIVCSYVGPIEVRERTKFHCIISMEKDRLVQKINILGFYRPNTPRNHDSMPRVPRQYARDTKRRNFLNVYTIKDKPQILYFNLFFIVNIMNNYFTFFVRVKGHFMTLKHL